MKFKLQLVIENEEGQTHLEDIIQLNKSHQPSYCLGLSLLESKELLKKLQQKIVVHQAEAYLHSQVNCEHFRIALIMGETKS